MSHVIYKYKLPPMPGDHKLEMIRGARILGVGEQDDRLVFWAIVNPENDTEYRTLSVRFTGRDSVSDLVDAIYLGTAQIDAFVCHVFERKHV